jgi:hypothetical protein
LRDAQAVETTQAEQAAFYLAASAVMSQSASATKVEPIAIDQRWGGSELPVFTIYLTPEGTIVCGEVDASRLHVIECMALPHPTDDGALSSGQTADDTGVSTDIASGNAGGTDDASLPSSDVASLDGEPVDRQSVALDDPAMVNSQPSSEFHPETGDSATDPTSVDDVPPIMDESGGAALDSVADEPQANNAEVEAVPEDVQTDAVLDEPLPILTAQCEPPGDQ